METVLKAIADWIKGILTAGIMSNLSGLFDDVNTQVGNIAQQVGTKPSSFEPRVFAMIESLSRNVVLPIAGIILTFIACYELIEMITQHNNMAQFEPALIMRWIFKTAISVWLISNTFDIVMAVFDVTQKVVSDSSSIIAGNTRVNDIGLSMLQSSLMQMDVGPLFGLFLQSFFIGITMRILSIVIFVIVYGRMIEIYCMVSLAPIPMATFGNHEQSHMGQNYLKCLFALGFQGFLILICVAIYRKKLKNPNGLILGTPGSGKSFSAKREIANAFLVTDDDIIICDPEAEYAPLVERLHGQVIHIGPASTQYINPMDINSNYSEEDNPLALKADFIQEEDSAEVNEMVRTAKVTPEQLAALLRQSANTTPNPAALSAVGATFEKEDDADED